MPVTTTPLPEVDEPLGMPSRLLRILGVVVALVLVLFWIWIFAGGPKRANPDRLDDRAFAARSETRCQQLLTDLKTLPSAQESGTATARADVLDQATVMVRAMVRGLEGDAPTTGDDGDRLQGWFRDWNRYLRDRDNYATRLRTDPNAQFLVTENEELKDSVDKTIEVFADVNDMPSCATPGDVG